MFKLFLFSFLDLIKVINIELIFLSCIGVIVLLSIICIVLSIFKLRYSKGKRLWIVCCYIGLLIIQLWAELTITKQLVLSLLTLGIEVLLLSIVLFIPERGKSASLEQKTLAKFLDGCIKKERDIDFNKQSPTGFEESKKQRLSTSIIKGKTEQDSEMNDGENDIDFSHVKNILSKLDYYPLKDQDKKAAKDLESAILKAEQEGLSYPIKESINDGLGALLKIMSKYAV